jgi:hypothetical protein
VTSSGFDEAALSDEFATGVELSDAGDGGVEHPASRSAAVKAKPVARMAVPEIIVTE